MPSGNLTFYVKFNIITIDMCTVFKLKCIVSFTIENGEVQNEHK